MELAVAALAARLPQDVVAPAAAEALTVVHTGAGFVAYPPLRPSRVHMQLLLTEVGRLLEIHQVINAGSPPIRGLRLLQLAQLSIVSVVGPYKGGHREPVLQNGANRSKLRGDLPTGLELAAS